MILSIKQLNTKFRGNTDFTPFTTENKPILQKLFGIGQELLRASLD